ncbi:MAG TPA: alpha-galactosidase [Nocardioidaceae bacterium]|nr:alpha-galactosidase [Nocardioidaceae bacterium]
MAPDPILHLRAAGTSVVLDCRGSRLPRVLHWGRDLGPLEPAALEALAHGLLAQRPTNVLDVEVPVSLLPEHSAGWLGTPGLRAHREGRDFSTAFVVRTIETPGERAGRQSVRLDADDRHAGVQLSMELELTDSGLLRMRAAVTNEAAVPLTLDGLLLALPVPSQARELLDLTGRHLRERTPQRHDFTFGTHMRENRRGRTGTDASIVLAAGEPGFGFREGQVWGIHVAWSGNHVELAEATTAGVRLLGGGESLLPGEMRLGLGESYTSPWVYAAHGEGLDELSARFHRYLRSRPQHPATERPVTLNTWEAVYFDQDLDRLATMADIAAGVGVERFVLDDGWFRGRKDDTAGLGDWYVDEEVWPQGLHPLVKHVHDLGMQFGLWVEPEMINPDSDLARLHPDWILHAGDRLPPLSRNQQVLDVANPEAYAYLLARLDTLVAEYAVDYLKWDHNRDLVDAGLSARGTAGVHAQTLSVYRLMDELRARHPALEIESCSSGGGRVDIAVLERTERVWASDCIDPLERQQIQRWTTLLLPPELVGAHVGSPISHTTGRTHSLDFRAGTAFFGHFGIEWDLTTTTDSELARLGEWITAYKELRGLLHSGDVVRGDHPDPALWVHGVVAQDGARAVYALVQTSTSIQSPPGPVRLPGLDPQSTYFLKALPPGDRIEGPATSSLAWWQEGIRLTGRVLGEVGVQAPLQFPERLVLVEAVRLDSKK